MIRLALPDGHQQKHIIGLLEATGIRLDGYDLGKPLRRPKVNLDGVEVTVIRPQDMPAQVALGNFDLALTGVDWLYDHLFRFPKSPVAGLLDLGIGRVRIVSVVTEDTPADDLSGINRLVGEGYFPAPFFRVASEYVNIADRFAMARRFSRYRVIPTYGATEALLPEDADMIIENTETGTTLKKNKLKIIDELFISVGCLIGKRGVMEEGDPAAKRVHDEIMSIAGVTPHQGVEM